MATMLAATRLEPVIGTSRDRVRTVILGLRDAPVLVLRVVGERRRHFVQPVKRVHA